MVQPQPQTPEIFRPQFYSPQVCNAGHRNTGHCANGWWLPFLIIATVAAVSGGCRRNSPDTGQQAASADPAGPPEVELRIRKVEHCEEIENLLQLTDRIYSGGEPGSESAMQRLSELGIQTIVSVDGAQPDVQLAKKYGMRYVHIPIGYDGIAIEAVQSLAKAVREIEGPIFVHCHHGKHRGPAAAAICAVVDVGLDPQQATEVLKTAGTSPDYVGLWRDVAAFKSPSSTTDFPPLVEVATVDSFVSAMAAMGRAHDHLVLLKATGWQQRADHPDLVAQQQALILYEGYRESLRFLEQSNPYDEQIKAEMFTGLQLLENLQENLAAGNVETANALFSAIQSGCKSCHTSYRD